VLFLRFTQFVQEKCASGCDDFARVHSGIDDESAFDFFAHVDRPSPEMSGAFRNENE
jgi:hypothetical protein